MRAGEWGVADFLRDSNRFVDRLFLNALKYNVVNILCGRRQFVCPSSLIRSFYKTTGQLCHARPSRFYVYSNMEPVLESGKK